MVGTEGTTNWVTSNDYILGNAYEKDQTDYFRLTFDKSVGTITGINIKSDMSDSNAGWHLDYVEVYETVPIAETPSYHTNNGGKFSVNAWIEDTGVKSYTLGKVSTLRASSKPGTTDVDLEVEPESAWGDYKSIHIYRADTPNGEYQEVLNLTNRDDFKGMDPNLVEGERYYYKLFLEKEDGTLVQVAKLFCIEVGKGLVEIPEIKVDGETLDAGDITDDLAETGLDTVGEIEAALKNALRKLNSGITEDNMAFYDLQLYYEEFGEWLPADESHFPEDGVISVTIPLPEGSDAADTFCGVHMFSEDAFGKEAGKTEVLEIGVSYDEDGQAYLNFTVTGLSPVIIGWTDGETAPDTSDDDQNENENTTQKGEEESGATATGDTTNLAPWIITAAASGAAVILAGGVLLIIRKRK